MSIVSGLSGRRSEFSGCRAPEPNLSQESEYSEYSAKRGIPSRTGTEVRANAGTACPWRITELGQNYVFFSGFDTVPGWRDVLILSSFLICLSPWFGLPSLLLLLMLLEMSGSR